MENSKINRQYTCEYDEDGRKYKLEINYGFNVCGTQEPCFSITADLYELIATTNLWRMVSCGCQHELIAEYAPHLAPLIKWHLCFVHSGPMHYKPNAKFWLERSTIKQLNPIYRGDTCAIGNQAMEYFLDTIAYGSSLSYDRIGNVILKNYQNNNIEKQYISIWLDKRLPEVMKAFHKDMHKFEVEV